MFCEISAKSGIFQKYTAKFYIFPRKICCALIMNNTFHFVMSLLCCLSISTLCSLRLLFPVLHFPAQAIDHSFCNPVFSVDPYQYHVIKHITDCYCTVDSRCQQLD